MVSVIIPTRGQESPVVATLAALVPGAAAGVIKEVLLVDRPGTEAIARVADVAGCNFVAIEGSLTEALAAGARQARSDWLMFLHPGAVLDHGWIDETTQFIQTVAMSGQPRAGVFRYARSPYAPTSPRDAAQWLIRLFAGPFSDQGLLISRAHYDRLGGHSATARRPEARLLSHLGRSGRAMLRTRIFVPAGP
ncbi:MAG: glycosyl transferase [Xanthobacteraceae bacterium]